jgi:predicted Ser/Thr protein kinase
VVHFGRSLTHGFVVDRVLGRGATATALLVTRKEKQCVLKVALNEDNNARLREEAEALRTLHSEFIVAIEDELKMYGRTVLVLQKAGDKTLAAQLRSDGVPTLEMLFSARFNDIEAVKKILREPKKIVVES